jgi:hypothetical protein
MINFFGGIKEMKNMLKRRFKRMSEVLVKDQRGEGFVDVLVKMLIVVVVGAVLMTIMRATVPTLFDQMITKIQKVFEL